jgi:virulence-associated protein VagC
MQTDETTVFKVGNSMAIRLIGGCKLPRGTRVRERGEGNTIVIEPVIDSWPTNFLEAAGSWDEDIERLTDEDVRNPFA